MATSDIEIQKGNPYVKNITFRYKSDGTIIPLTGRTLFFTVKNIADYADNDDQALITQDITVHTDGDNGITQLSLSAAQTLKTPGKYKADFRIYNEATPLTPVAMQINSVTVDCYIVDIVTKRLS